MLGTAPVTLHLVRHGVAAGAEGRCVGRTDLPLAAAGRPALGRLAAAWRPGGPPATPARPPRLASSDLRRARESAAVLAAAWGLTEPVAADPRLREMDFGAWDGRTWAELERDDGPAFGAWMAEWREARTPGGEGFGDVIARAAAWMRDAVGAARADGVADVVAVAHAGSIRALLVHALELPRGAAFRVRVDHARVTALRVGDGAIDSACRSAELLHANAV